LNADSDACYRRNDRAFIHRNSSSDGVDTQQTTGHQYGEGYAAQGEFSVFCNNMSEIVDPRTNKWVPMPASNKGKKEILTQLFFKYTKASVLRSHKVNLVEFFKMTPKVLWDTMFTAAETKAMANTQAERLERDIRVRFRPIFEEWRTLEGNPMKSLPTTMAELREATSAESSKARAAWMEAMLMEKNPRTDAWLPKIYEFLDALSLEQLLNPADGRRLLAWKMGQRAEFYLGNFVLKMLGMMLTMGNSVAQTDSMIADLYAICPNE